MRPTRAESNQTLGERQREWREDRGSGEKTEGDGDGVEGEKELVIIMKMKTTGMQVH